MTDSATRMDDGTDSQLIPDGGDANDETDSEAEDAIGSGLSEALDSDRNDEEPSSETVVEKKTVVKGENRSPSEYLELAAVFGLVIVVGVTLLRFYTSASQAIERVVSSYYVPIFQAVFNLALLLVSLALLSVLVRRRFDLA